jgi:hypothetical protein
MCRIETPGERSSRTEVISVRPLKGSIRARAILTPTRTPCTAHVFPYAVSPVDVALTGFQNTQRNLRCAVRVAKN